MKKGYSFISFRDVSFSDIGNFHECLKVCSEAGYDGVELTIEDDSPLTMKSTDSEILAVRKMVEDYGLKVHSVCGFGGNLASDDANERKAGRDAIERTLETAALIGADGILSIPGIVGSDFMPDAPLIPYEKAYERSQEMLGTLTSVAESCKVNIAIENIWNKFLLSPIEMRRFVDELNSDYLGVYFDVGNIILTGYPEDWIRTLGKRIKKLHFCDFKRGSASLAGFCDLLEGDVNFPEVMKALKEIGYDNYLTVEMDPNYKQFPLQSIRSNAVSLDFILTL